MWIKNALKLLLAGTGATVCRILGQLLIPEGSQTVLAPSVFAQNGTMPLAFTIYGIFAYSAIAAMFCLLRGRLPGGRVVQGLKYGLSCCVIWVVYLWEPLPHVAFADRLTYPLADSVALLVMGLLCGLLLGTPHRVEKQRLRLPLVPFLAITLLFVAGRLLQYTAIGIYSSFRTSTVQTILWATLTGACVALAILWWHNYLPPVGRYARALLLGGVLFGVDLLLFNFFMPLVFTADIPDLLVRTALDALCVSLGCLALKKPAHRPTKPQ